MPAFILSLVFLFVCLYGYYLGVRPSRLEREIRKTKSDYTCFNCKKKIDINDLKCSDCDFVTIYGKRRKKYIIIFPIIIGYLFVLVKFNKTGMFV